MSWYPYHHDVEPLLCFLETLDVVKDFSYDGLTRLLRWLYDCLDCSLTIDVYEACVVLGILDDFDCEIYSSKLCCIYVVR